MYSGHGRLCVSLSLFLAAFPHYCTDPGVTWGNGRVLRSCALLGGFAIGARVTLRCYDNIGPHISKLIALYTANAYSAEREISASADTRSMAGLIFLAPLISEMP